VIPDRAMIGGTVRTLDEAVTGLFEQRIREVSELIARANRASAQIKFRRTYPPTINHASEAAFAAQVAADVVGPQLVTSDADPRMAAEDFAYMLREKPGAYLLLGYGSGGHRDAGHGAGPCMLHNASYDFNDELIPVGASFWVRLAERFLAR
jgi:metal-dependent amidase/aminoacylase/carboxypeptidase family protein